MTGPRLTNTDPALRRGWHPAAMAVDVGEHPLSVELLGEHWVLVRLPVGGPISAFVDACPHRGAPLSAGTVDGGSLRCPYHGWCFDASGGCTEIPSMGVGAAIPPKAKARVPYAVEERHGIVWIAPEEPVAPLLEVPEEHEPGFMVADLPPVRARVGAGLMLDNFLDQAHFAFIHAATIGTPEAEVVHDLDIERDGFSMTVRSEHPFPNREDPGVATGERPLIQTRRLTYEYRAPFAISLRIDYVEAGGTNVLAFAVQPERDDSCVVYTRILRNDLEGDPHRLAEAVSFEQKVIEEDVRLQERYRDRSLPLDITEEVHVKADRMTVELRRILADLVKL
jgi:vanillate O-demethylase monooxygenase subunit